MSDPLNAAAATVPSLALRPRDAARALSISERTLWYWTKAGIVPSVRVGHVTLYPVDAVRKWLAEQAQKNGGQEQ
jgi:predicted site-specific integrase-resolvase